MVLIVGEATTRTADASLAKGTRLAFATVAMESFGPDPLAARGLRAVPAVAGRDLRERVSEQA